MLPVYTVYVDIYVLSFLMGGYLGMELLGHMETLLNLSGTVRALALFYVLFRSSGGLVSLGHHEDNGGTSG